MSRKQVKQYPRKNCYFCSGEGPLESHHIVPKRHGGVDSDNNLVDLCPTCHEKLERLYDKRFYENLNVDGSNKQTMDKKLERARYRGIVEEICINKEFIKIESEIVYMPIDITVIPNSLILNMYSRKWDKELTEQELNEIHEWYNVATTEFKRGEGVFDKEFESKMKDVFQKYDREWMYGGSRIVDNSYDETEQIILGSRGTTEEIIATYIGIMQASAKSVELSDIKEKFGNVVWEMPKETVESYVNDLKRNNELAYSSPSQVYIK